MTYDTQISPDTGGYGGSPPDFSSGDTVIGISADGLNYTPVPDDGSSATVNLTYESVSSDAQGDSSTTLPEGGQQLINLINANNANPDATGPLSDTYYYEVSDGTQTAIESVTDTYGDVSATSGVNGTDELTPGESISLTGFSIDKALSTDSDGNPIASNPSLAIDIAAFNFNTQQDEGIFSATTDAPGGGGVVTLEPDGSIMISGTESEINANLTTLGYTAGASGDATVAIYTVDESYANPNAPGYQSATYLYGEFDVACFLAGTKIATADGDMPVETLRIGGFVKTLDAGLQKIKWIGRRSYDGRLIAGNKDILPIRIAKGAIGEEIPARDLVVSPGHAICIDGALVQAFRLVNGISITQAASVESVTYYHIETENHEVIFAENCPAETFLDETFRAQFQNAEEYRALYPNQSAASTACLPRLEDGFALHAIQQRLNARAGILPPPETRGAMRGYVDEPGPAICSGWAQDVENPETPLCLDILIDGRRVARVLANLYRADLRQAGLGSGCHAFRATLPEGVAGRLEIRRAADGAELAWTEAALALAA